MNKYIYEVQLPLDGRPNEWFTVATCDAAVKAAEVLRILLEHPRDGLAHIRVQISLYPHQRDD